MEAGGGGSQGGKANGSKGQGGGCVEEGALNTVWPEGGGNFLGAKTAPATIQSNPITFCMLGVLRTRCGGRGETAGGRASGSRCSTLVPGGGAVEAQPRGIPARFDGAHGHKQLVWAHIHGPAEVSTVAGDYFVRHGRWV